MVLYGSNVDYGLHSLLHLVDPPAGRQSAGAIWRRFRGVSPSLVAKLFTQLQKVGIAESAEGIRGRFRLVRAPRDTSVFDVVLALEGDEPLFRCREIRRNWVLYGDSPPGSATRGVRAIHAVMLQAEQRMLDALRGHTMAGLAGTVDGKTMLKYADPKQQSFRNQHAQRQVPAGLRSKA